MAESKIGKKIKELLYLKRMSQSDLARKAGINVQVVSNWITGFRKPKLENLQKLAKALDTTVEDLLTEPKKKSVLTSQEIIVEKMKILEKKLEIKDEEIKNLKERISFLEEELSFYKNKEKLVATSKRTGRD